MHAARSLVVHRLPGEGPLALLASRQAQYLCNYLHELGATWAIEEPLYFDRDFLSEFATFYSTSASGYSNACQRLTFFSLPQAEDAAGVRSLLERALAGEEEAAGAMQRGFLGFTVLRPIRDARLARTVVRWYDDHPNKLPRTVEPTRPYHVHLAGLKLTVSGIAWQQQDQAVGACATVALWTMLHSSALDEHHSIPTTTLITRAAHARSPLGQRAFPSKGLTMLQVLQAIQELGLAPILTEGNVTKNGLVLGFSREFFGSDLAAFIRSGYPVLLAGSSKAGEHAVCAVGVRSAPPPAAAPGDMRLEDESLEAVYIHDDNLGPNVRYVIREIQQQGRTVVCLEPEAPVGQRAGRPFDDPLLGVGHFLPRYMVVAVHEEIRTSPSEVSAQADHVTKRLSIVLAHAAAKAGIEAPGLTVGLRYMRLSQYLGEELPRRLSGQRLAAVRLELCESIPPMSLFVAVARVGAFNAPILDLVYDTTDSTPCLRAFAHVPIEPWASGLLDEAVALLPDSRWDKWIGPRADPDREA